jgi:hypothetical protein
MNDFDENLAIIMGVLSIIIVLYRVIYIGYPIFMDGYKKKDISIILKAMTQLV